MSIDYKKSDPRAEMMSDEREKIDQKRSASIAISFKKADHPDCDPPVPKRAKTDAAVKGIAIVIS